MADPRALHSGVRAASDFAGAEDGLAEQVVAAGDAPAHAAAGGAVAFVQALLAPQRPKKVAGGANKRQGDDDGAARVVDVDVTAAEAACVRRLRRLCGLSEQYVLQVYFAAGKNEATAASLLTEQ